MHIPLDAFVELDRLNMSPVIEATGGTFDPAFRRARLMAEIEADSSLDAVWQDNRLVAYLKQKLLIPLLYFNHTLN